MVGRTFFESDNRMESKQQSLSGTFFKINLT